MTDYIEKPLPSVRIAQLTATVARQEDIGPAVGPLFARVHGELGGAGVPVVGADVAWYEVADDGIHLGVGSQVDVDTAPADLEVVDLSEHGRALTVVHRGGPETFGDGWSGLFGEIATRGLTPNAPCREVYLATPMDAPDAWVTELQQPVA